MSSGNGGKPSSGSSPGRPAADTPQRLVVRSMDSKSDSMLGATDTAVAMATSTRGDNDLGTSVTDAVQPLDKSLLATSTGELVGSTLSERYLVTRKVGQGGMGAVYEATHTLIGKRVAVKVLLEKYAQREAIVTRLKQEAQLASSIRHEHIIDITDFGNTNDGRTFVVMEYLEGESLAELLARETKLGEQRILRIILQAASALAAAHEKGIVHRDIKPENLFLLKRKEQDFVKVLDFGISKSLRASDDENEPPRLTQTGMVLGTPLYMSPEQARGDDTLDHRVDIYALGVIMYEAATGRVPFAGNNYLSVISQVLNEEPKHVRELVPELSEEFEAIVARAMEKDRNERYASAKDLLSDLSALLDDPTRSTERAKITGPRRKALQRKIPGIKLPVWIGAIALVITAVIVTVMFAMGGPPSKPQANNQNTPPPPPPAPDAQVAVLPPVDAPPPPAETVQVRFETIPPGATIIGEDDGVSICEKTPCTQPLALKNEDYKLIASFAGYDDRKFKVNAVVMKAKDNPVIKVVLQKAIGREPKTVPHKDPKGSGSTDNSSQKTNGEVGRNPYKDGSTIKSP
jgi:serine/threonine protein kinase